MKKTVKIKKAITNYLFDHQGLSFTLEFFKGMFFAAIAGMIFAFGFACFITPDSLQEDSFLIITGGVSGLSQNIVIILELFGITAKNNLFQSIFYFCINIPLIIFAFFKIGKRFSVLTLLDVGLTSLFISLFSNADWSQTIAHSPILNNSTLTRVLIAGVCTGASSGLAFIGEGSCGGLDIITYYISMKKSTSVGKYSIVLNAFVISLYAILRIIEKPGNWQVGVYSILFSILYLFICGLVIDALHLRNKKIQLQIVTSVETMPNVLLAYFPHGATIARGMGAYTHADREVIWIVVSSYEVKKVIKVAKQVDEHVFISSIPLNQVYGKFYTRPVE